MPADSTCGSPRKEHITDDEFDGRSVSVME